MNPNNNSNNSYYQLKILIRKSLTIILSQNDLLKKIYIINDHTSLAKFESSDNKKGIHL